MRPYVMVHDVRRLMALGVALGGLAVVGPVVTVAPMTPVAASTTAASSDCAGEANQRVRVGSTRPDRNSLTPAQVAQSNNALATRQRKLPNVAKIEILRPTSKIDVPVYVNVIKSSSGGGAVTTEQIADQMAVLNTAFDTAGFSFTLISTRTTVNNNWYSWDENVDDKPAKEALHRGGITALNMYFTAFTDRGLLGYATFPFENAGKRDGVVMANGTLPRGSQAGYNLGDTVVHEVGHWLGLFHTFQDGCSFVNDAVKDTPAQKDGQNVLGCNTRDDTCPTPGLDPVRNYMSYGNDVCLNNFTAGQGYRMRSIWYTYRASATQIP